MTSKPKVSLAQRRGISAEAEIKGVLNSFSIPAKPEPDVGIDFLCELLEDHMPAGRFFGVQCKERKTVKDGQRIWIKKTTIRHWLQLSFPVFLVVLDENQKELYWVSVTDNFWALNVQLSDGNRTLSLNLDKSCILEKGEDKNQKFISKAKDDLAMISLFHGHPQFGEGYVRTLPIAYLSSEVRTRLEANIRTSLNFLVNHWLLEKQIERAYFLCEFLTRFDENHYDHFWKFGHINRLMGRKLEAKASFEKAIEICRGDRKYNLLKRPSDPPIEQIIEVIQQEIKRL